MIYCLIGLSGSGKSLLEDLSPIEKIVSCTTREPRAGEVNGVDYWFISDEQYDEYKNEGKFAEISSNNGNRYGILKEELEVEYDRVVVIDMHGYHQLKQMYKSQVKGIYVRANIIKCFFRMLSRGDGIKEAIRRTKINMINLDSYKELPFTIENNGEIEMALNKFKEIRKKKVYLSGKISGLDFDKVTDTFRRAERVMLVQGYDVINPLDLKPVDKPNWEGYMARDIIELVSKADYIYFVDRCEDSDGKNIEKFIAEKRGIPTLNRRERWKNIGRNIE